MTRFHFKYQLSNGWQQTSHNPPQKFPFYCVYSYDLAVCHYIVYMNAYLYMGVLLAEKTYNRITTQLSQFYDSQNRMNGHVSIST